MPKSVDNQDLPDDPETGKKENDKDTQPGKNKDLPDENNFSSDNQKGKKVDADPEKPSEQPADL